MKIFPTCPRCQREDALFRVRSKGVVVGLMCRFCQTLFGLP
jgi:hypothetical protein